MTAPLNETTRRGRLALALQEPLTTVARLRSNKQVAADADSFRTRIKQVLAAAEQDARGLGYAAEDVRFALFAVIAFLDETVLNCGQAMFADWSRRTLQEEVFGVHMAGELFFQYLEQLMAKQDSADLVDVLEVYSLCLLLGFKGRYSATHGGDIQVLIRQLAEKTERVRGKLGELSPRWRPPDADIGRRRDKWVPRLAVLAGATFLIAVVLYASFAVSLRSGDTDMKTETARLSR
ncbi:MAG TPA: DotU family type IV/VI secretion system protein [Gemmatimonadaceae bacterium]|nr:DotU family type IV/VI secretion system protein [Gemmatimonadaceae bacterium]